MTKPESGATPTARALYLATVYTETRTQQALWDLLAETTFLPALHKGLLVGDRQEALSGLVPDSFIRLQSDLRDWDEQDLTVDAHQLAREATRASNTAMEEIRRRRLRDRRERLADVDTIESTRVSASSSMSLRDEMESLLFLIEGDSAACELYEAIWDRGLDQLRRGRRSAYATLITAFLEGQPLPRTRQASRAKARFREILASVVHDIMTRGWPGLMDEAAFDRVIRYFRLVTGRPRQGWQAFSEGLDGFRDHHDQDGSVSPGP